MQESTQHSALRPPRKQRRFKKDSTTWRLMEKYLLNLPDGETRIISGLTRGEAINMAMGTNACQIQHYTDNGAPLELITHSAKAKQSGEDPDIWYLEFSPSYQHRNKPNERMEKYLHMHPDVKPFVLPSERELTQEEQVAASLNPEDDGSRTMARHFKQETAYTPAPATPAPERVKTKDYTKEFPIQCAAPGCETIILERIGAAVFTDPDGTRRLRCEVCCTKVTKIIVPEGETPLMLAERKIAEKS